MSVKAKPQPTELDHIRDTLTDIVGSVGKVNNNIEQVQQHLLKHDHRFDQHDGRFDQQDREIAEIKEMLKVILSRL